MRNKPSELMVFAAGFGTRMQPLTNNLPKPLISVGGRTLLDHSLDIANAASIEKTVVNTHYLGDQIKNHLFGQPYIVEHEPEILETGGGLQNARHHFSGPSVLTCNSDSVWVGENPLRALQAAWRNDWDALLLCAHTSNINGRDAPGDFNISDNGLISRSGDWVYLGAQIIRLSLLDNINQTSFSLNLVWDKLMLHGKLHGAEYSGKWCDVGSPENIPIAEKMMGFSGV